MGSVVCGTGKALPQLEVSNDDLSAIVDTSDEWITKRTGIHNRRIAVQETATSLAVDAGLQALDAAGFSAESLDLVICATSTPDSIMPSQAALVRRAIGARNAAAFDVNSACTGCVVALTLADSLLKTLAGAKRALVVGAECMSRIVDWTDRGTCVLFGDGAGAVALESQAERRGIFAARLKGEDDADNVLTCPATYPAPVPFRSEAPDGGSLENSQVISMKGREVFKFATRVIPEMLTQVAADAGMPLEDVRLIVPHQANLRIIAYAAKKLGLPLERFQVSIAETGNTSAASALMALCDAYREGKLQQGDVVAMAGFGAGLSAGALLLEV